MARFFYKHFFYKYKIPFIFVGAVLVLLAVFSFSLTTNKIVNKNACGEGNLSENFDESLKLGIYEGKNIDVPAVAFANTNYAVLGTTNEERWIEVDLSEQKLKAWEGNTLFLETLVSTGLPWWKTPEGEFRVWLKVRATKMEGGTGRYYYYLPNVPYVMFFENAEIPGYRGYSLHGTYWHNDFGRVRSHGCVNLPTSIAERLYYWTSPQVPEGKGSVRSSADNLGTRIVVHE